MITGRLLALCLFLTVIATSCYKEEMVFTSRPNAQLELALLLSFDDKDCFYDEETKRLRYSITGDSVPNFSPLIRFQEHAAIQINGVPLVNNAVNNLGMVQVKKSYPVRITSHGETETLELSFTTLPMARIVTTNKIVDEPKLLARLTVNYASPDSAAVSSYVGIEYRGASSQKNPKKSYGFTFLKSLAGNTPASKALFGCAPNEDWILDALYFDQAKFRNKLSFEVWKAMNPTEHAAIQSNFVELYLNHEFQGLYCLNEKIDAQQLGLLDTDAVLYKAVAWGDGTSFIAMRESSPPLYTDLWDGWEQKYPDAEVQLVWQPLFELRNWVINTSDREFLAEVTNRINLDNVADYYLFLHLIGARDNHGKNMFLLSSGANAPFEIIPWDLDATWGRNWDSEPTRSRTIRSNELYNRLLTLNPDGFKAGMQQKWLTLRANPWSSSSIEALLLHYLDELERTDVIALDNARWGQQTNLEQERAYLRGWLMQHLEFMDAHFRAL